MPRMLLSVVSFQMVSARCVAVILGVMLGATLVLGLLYMQLRTVRELREMMAAQGHRGTQAQTAPPPQTPPPQTTHSTNLLKSLLTSSTLSSVADLCRYKTEVGALGSLDADIQRLDTTAGGTSNDAGDIVDNNLAAE